MHVFWHKRVYRVISWEVVDKAAVDLIEWRGIKTFMYSCVNKKGTKSIAHHPVIQGLSLNPLQSPTNSAPRGEMRMKNQYETLGALAKQALKTVKMHISGSISTTPDSSIFPYIEKH